MFYSDNPVADAERYYNHLDDIDQEKEFTTHELKKKATIELNALIAILQEVASDNGLILSEEDVKEVMIEVLEV